MVKTWSVLRETCHQTLLGVYYCVEMVKIGNNSHMLEFTFYVALLGFFLTIFDIFWHKIVQTLFVLRETLHTTLFVIYYFLDIIRIQNIESYA